MERDATRVASGAHSQRVHDVHESPEDVGDQAQTERRPPFHDRTCAGRGERRRGADLRFEESSWDADAGGDARGGVDRDRAAATAARRRRRRRRRRRDGRVDAPSLTYGIVPPDAARAGVMGGRRRRGSSNLVTRAQRHESSRTLGGKRNARHETRIRRRAAPAADMSFSFPGVREDFFRAGVKLSPARGERASYGASPQLGPGHGTLEHERRCALDDAFRNATHEISTRLAMVARAPRIRCEAWIKKLSEPVRRASSFEKRAVGDVHSLRASRVVRDGD